MKHDPHHIDNEPGEPPTSPTRLGRLRRAFGRTVSGGASWGEVHIAGGDAAFALGSAPAGAEPVRAQRGTDRAGWETERGLPPDHEPPSDPSHPGRAADIDVDVARFAPTVTPEKFTHHAVAANDLPAPAYDDARPGSEGRRRLNEVLYRPRSGTKRDVQLTCSAEPAERDFIDRAAREAKRSRSAYLMDAALTFAHAYLPDQRPTAIPALPSPRATQDLMVMFGRLIREFHRIGVNLNQVTRALHTGELPERAEEVLDELHRAARLTGQALEQVLAGGGRRGA